MDINLKNNFSSKSEVFPDSFNKIKNMSNPLEDDISGKNLLLKEKGAIQKEEKENFHNYAYLF